MQLNQFGSLSISTQSRRSKIQALRDGDYPSPAPSAGRTLMLIFPSQVSGESLPSTDVEILLIKECQQHFTSRNKGLAAAE